MHQPFYFSKWIAFQQLAFPCTQSALNTSVSFLPDKLQDTRKTLLYQSKTVRWLNYRTPWLYRIHARAYTAQGNLQNKSSFVVNTQKFTILVFSPFVNQDILSFKYFTIRWVGRHSLQNMCIHYMYVSNFECMYLCIHEYWNCCWQEL